MASVTIHDAHSEIARSPAPTQQPAPTVTSGAAVHRRKTLALTAGATAVAAWAGAAGLATGTLSLGAKLTARLPFESPVLGGSALAAIVALPFTVLAVLAWRTDRRTGFGAAAAGTLLIGWIVVELAFIRAVSFLQPVCVLVGVLFVLVGRRQALRWLHARAGFA
jgi:hypothetical protein